MPDKVIKMKPEDYLENGVFSPAKAKLSLYKYSEFEETIYLDVDGLLLKELDFEIKEFATHVNGYSDLENDRTEFNLWVTPQQAYEKYNIPKENKLAGTNSSFMAWTKKGEKVFKKALENLSNPFQLNELRYQWGQSKCQPDELYLNIALAQLGTKIEEINPLYTKKRGKPYSGATEIMKKYILCCWGGLEFNHHEISGTGNSKTGLYNQLCRQNFLKVYGEDLFYDHFYALISKKIYEKGIKKFNYELL